MGSWIIHSRTTVITSHFFQHSEPQRYESIDNLCNWSNGIRYQNAYQEILLSCSLCYNYGSLAACCCRCQGFIEFVGITQDELRGGPRNVLDNPHPQMCMSYFPPNVDKFEQQSHGDVPTAYSPRSEMQAVRYVLQGSFNTSPP